ncbi:MAG: hypothetical protein K8L97_02980 [Anaerolineae bacterium]|nr:hypothetical protein [Anaerolineae bacterium]
MDGGTILLLIFLFTLILFIIQRTESKRRRGVAIFMFLFVPIILWYVGLRQSWGTAVVALLVALILNFLFWLLIGRYNPVGSSDSIRVLGMDD